MTNTNYIGSPLDNFMVDPGAPRVGYKIAMFTWNEGDVKIVPPHYFNKVTALTADAECSKKHETSESFQKCSCGFYAYDNIAAGARHADDFNRAANCFFIEVSLSGTVVVAEKGLNASHQRVKTVVVPPCWSCGDKLSEALVEHGSGYLVGGCTNCIAKAGGTPISFQEFSEATVIPGFSPIAVWSSRFELEDLDKGFDNREARAEAARGISKLIQRRDVVGLINMKFELDELVAKFAEDSSNDQSREGV